LCNLEQWSHAQCSLDAQSDLQSEDLDVLSPVHTVSKSQKGPRDVCIFAACVYLKARLDLL